MMRSSSEEELEAALGPLRRHHNPGVRVYGRLADDALSSLSREIDIARGESTEAARRRLIAAVAEVCADLIASASATHEQPGNRTECACAMLRKIGEGVAKRLAVANKAARAGEDAQ